MRFTLLTILLIISIRGLAQSLPTASEYQALMDLYTSTNGSGWTNKTGWSTADPNVIQSVASWYGVTTDTQGHVLYLNLTSNNLNGSLPTNLGDLTHVQSLVLKGNLLSGPIPANLDSMVDLYQLDISDNTVSGSIPASLGNLSKIILLNLSNNQLSGAIPSSIGNLNVATEIWLQNNQLTGSLPSELGNLSKVKYLYLQNNNLTGSIPTTLGNLPKLENLSLHFNQLSGLIPASIGNISTLLYLAISNNQLTGEIPSSIGNLTHLNVLMLNNNQLTGAIPTTLTNLTSLIRLELNSNQLSGSIPSELSNLPLLNYVSLDHNSFSFSSFLTFKQNFSGGLNYLNQNLVDVQKTIQAQIGTALTLTTSIDRTTNPPSEFQWFKIVNGTQTPVNTASVNGHTYVIDQITSADQGVKYIYAISNSALPNLQLVSKEQIINTITCAVPIIDFQIQETNNSHTFTPSLTQAEGCTATYAWNFGDGQTSTDQVASHIFNEAGTYTVALTVSYQCGTCPASTLIKEYPVEVKNLGVCSSLYCDGAGNIGIGTRNTLGYRLSVNGKIRASDIIKVYPAGQWSDFVFDKKYKLRPLHEVETFIHVNGHLPEIPSAKEVETNGIEMGSMDAKLLQKIEELTLYMIEINKRSKHLEDKVSQLEKKNGALQKRINELN